MRFFSLQFSYPASYTNNMSKKLVFINAKDMQNSFYFIVQNK